MAIRGLCSAKVGRRPIDGCGAEAARGRKGRCFADNGLRATDRPRKARGKEGAVKASAPYAARIAPVELFLIPSCSTTPATKADEEAMMARPRWTISRLEA